PTWVEDSITHLQELCEDAQWTSLLVKWVELERQLGFPRGRANMLASSNRPAQVGVWIHDSRPWNEMPVIGPGVAEDYSTSWWLWWKSLQPSWRANTFSRDLRGTGTFDWNETRKGSQNGFFLVILSLGWWFKGEKGRWWCADAIKDVEWV
ncbi:hypothetical protein FIBSPDRAFT_669240, partial [Athelia psychrophila]